MIQFFGGFESIIYPCNTTRRYSEIWQTQISYYCGKFLYFLGARYFNSPYLDMENFSLKMKFG